MIQRFDFNPHISNYQVYVCDWNCRDPSSSKINVYKNALDSKRFKVAYSKQLDKDYDKFKEVIDIFNETLYKVRKGRSAME